MSIKDTIKNLREEIYKLDREKDKIKKQIQNFYDTCEHNFLSKFSHQTHNIYYCDKCGLTTSSRREI